MSPVARGALTRAQVAAVALEIADDEGLDALSMRTLAERLGVGTMTLYGYFASKDELLDAVVDSAVSDREPFALEGSPREQLRSVAMDAHRSLFRHPSLVELRVRRPVLRPEALHFAEAILSILLATGLDRAEAARGFRLLFTYTFGFAALSPGEVTEEHRGAARAALSELSSDEYPSLAGAIDEASDAMGGEEAFEYGLDRILDGLEARMPV